MTNKAIAHLLRNVAASYQIKDDKKYKFQIIAYNRAADAIENSPTEINDLMRSDKIEALPGIGKSIHSHIEELLTTGKVKQFEWIMNDIPASVFPLLDIPSFGPKKAYKLAINFDLKDPKTVIEDLLAIAKKGKIAGLEGFGEKSEKDIIQAIEEYKSGVDKTSRMVLPFASELAEQILSYMKQHKDVLEIYPLGSLRRRVATIGDLDFAVSTKKPKVVIEHFVNYPFSDRIIEQGEAGASILLTNGKHVDLLTQTPDRFGSLLQHFTGSKLHNVKLREIALKKNLSLSEYGILPIKEGASPRNTLTKAEIDADKEKRIAFDTEEKFYKYLGLQWVPPEIRENKGEIELAQKHKLPKLIEHTDIKGDFHLHSAFPIEPSHDMGKNTIEDMAKRALELKYEYIGFSEHNPSVSKHKPDEVYSLIQRRNDVIEQVFESNKNIRILKMLETDILANGDLAIDDKSLELLDATLVSIHSVFSMDRETMTKRVLKGLSHPKAKILTHPTGRLLNQRNGYELDWDKIFSYCATHHKAIEINSWPQRLDLPDALIFEALKYGVKFVINTDSHATEHMDLMQFGVSVARRGWATKDDILNTLPYNKLAHWLTIK